MNDLVVTTPDSPRRKRRAGRGRSLIPIGGERHARERSEGDILSLPPPDTAPTPRHWKSGVFGALDIGSTKMTCLIGKGEADGSLRVLGYGWRRSRGIRNGAVIDIHEAEQAIRATVGQAEDAADKRLDNVIVNLSCGHPESHVFNARMPIGGREITDGDVARVVAEGQNRARTEGRSIIHTFPIGYSVDDTGGIIDPRAHLCDHLTARLHMIDAGTTALRTLDSVVSRAELKIGGLVSAPLASGLAVLEDDERELGATVVEMGGETTSLAVFGEGLLLHTAHIPVGGMHVTRDLARMLSTNIADAERLKTVYGSAELASEDETESLPIQMTGDHASAIARVSRAKLVSAIRPRIEETLELVRDRLDSAGLGRAGRGRVVLTGGASLLEGIGPMAARILERPVRLGRPLHITGLPEGTAASAGFSTAAGLLAWAAGADYAFRGAATPEMRSAGLLRRFVGFLRDRA
ncbi:cell division protein FtsA [Brytella acorum]|uniref:Cell division protein FtsA n=1 Tax=Brytella acorum TaxID=2959299 RepID=A0AA35VCF7_9PROT|nr:cell division protein FtsA [Brytella acorum]MDF3623545.1 cell division protein FtsA [Brytella acorum]CAI9121630.1 cell division protein FtsA [Brytella acorum]